MKPKKRLAFTLIELLVVIAIIAILAAILFPVFAKARQKAQQTTCSADLKQFGNAFMMYASDYDERFPSPGGAASYVSAWDYDSGATINTYIAKGPRPPDNPNQIWGCPTYAGKAPWKKAAKAGLPFRSYGMNENLRGGVDENGKSTMDRDYPGSYPASTATKPSGWETGINLGQIKSPAQTVLLYEGCYRLSDGYVGRTGAMDGVQGYARTAAEQVSWNGYSYGEGWHNDHDEYLWTDGHVTSMHPEIKHDFPTGQATFAQNYWYAQKRR